MEPSFLDMAKRQIEHADKINVEYQGMALQWVQAFAAIAQAEAQERIADGVQRLAEVMETVLDDAALEIIVRARKREEGRDGD